MERHLEVASKREAGVQTYLSTCGWQAQQAVTIYGQ